jgi:drug/metabolite transporter (DMT)-like permease
VVEPVEPAEPRKRRRINVGPGRVLLLLYGVFALSASVRAGYQLATKFSHAPTAYLLSALAAAIYVVAAVAFGRGGERARRIALVACAIELVGVVTVGTWSLLEPERFPEATVWSDYGQGYGYIPLVLPVLGLAWLLRGSR